MHFLTAEETLFRLIDNVSVPITAARSMILEDIMYRSYEMIYVYY